MAATQLLGKVFVSGVQVVARRCVQRLVGPSCRAQTVSLSRGCSRRSRGTGTETANTSIFFSNSQTECLSARLGTAKFAHRMGMMTHSARIGPAVIQPKMDAGSCPEEEEEEGEAWEVKMLYDGDCPLCMREVGMLRGRNQRYRTIKFVDISAPDYSAEVNAGIDFETAMGRIHAIQKDGTILTNVQAFRKFYQVVGLGWVYAITNYEPIGRIADGVYGVWAKYRLQMTGRPPMAAVMESRRLKQVRLEGAAWGGVVVVRGLSFTLQVGKNTSTR